MSNKGNNSSNKHLYDISKSKRTRRALHVAEPQVEDEVKEYVRISAESATQVSNDGEENDQTPRNNGHVKLKEFINVDDFERGYSEDNQEVITSAGEQEEKRGAALGEYFADEKQLQLVTKQKPDDGSQGVKFKRIIKRYIKALTHLVKVKRDQRLGKLEEPVLRLKKN